MSTWILDSAHSTAAFSVKHMMIAKVHGAFGKMEGRLTFDSRNLSASTVEAVIDATSINTGEPKRDEHLRSPDFFDVANFPSLSFKSSRIVAGDEGEFKLIGTLSIRGNEREVTLDVEGPSAEHKDPYGNVKIGLSARTKIKRKEFGLTWNAALEAGGVLVGDEVTITLDVQFTKQA